MCYSMRLQSSSSVSSIDSLYNEIIEGIKQCKILGTIPDSIGIDTWGVDYALLDENDNLIDEIFSYRDERTLDVIDKVHDIILQGISRTFQNIELVKEISVMENAPNIILFWFLIIALFVFIIFPHLFMPGIVAAIASSLLRICAF